MQNSPILSPTLISSAIQYALLVELAEAVPPDKTMYRSGDPIDIAYNGTNVSYAALTTFYGNDLATGVNPSRGQDIVSFGFVAQDAGGNVVVAVRGTEGIFEWVQDTRFLLVPCPFVPGAGSTEDGFTAVYTSLRVSPNPASQTLVAALPTLPYPKPVTSLTICGHSLGGALVTQLALDVAANTRLVKPSVYTYASPRTGDSAFVATYNHLVPNTHRFANRLDLVPKLPLPPLYDHVLGLYDLNPMLEVKFDIICQHRLTTYLFLLSRLGGGPDLPLNAECAPA
jgi:hypothetical protein